MGADSTAGKGQVSRRGNCACRGHPEEFCPGDFWEREAELECLRTLFEAYADLSLETDRRMITPRNRPTLEKMAREGTRIRLRPSAGFHCISLNTPLGCFDYADLLNRPIHRAQVHLVEILLQNEVEPILEPEEFREKYGCSHRDGKGFRRALGISESFATQPPSLLKFLEERRPSFRQYNAEKAEASRQRCLEINRKRRREEEKVDDELDVEAPTPSPPPTSSPPPPTSPPASPERARDLDEPRRKRRRSRSRRSRSRRHHDRREEDDDRRHRERRPREHRRRDDRRH